MPLYDCMLLLKPRVRKDGLMDLVSRVGKHIYSRNGVVTEIKSFGHVQLGYGIKKLDGRYYQGQLMQMTMMATPNINKELHYLNKEDRLLRWLLVKHRDVKLGLEYMDDVKHELDSEGDDGAPSLPGCAPDNGQGEVMSEDIEKDDEELDPRDGWVYSNV